MKQILLICAVVALVGGCASTPTNWVSDPSNPNNVKIEKAIRKELWSHTGELTKADLEKVTKLNLNPYGVGNLHLRPFGAVQLTDVTGLEKLTRLTELSLGWKQLTEVPKGLEKLPQLEELYLQHNQLTDVKGLEKLTKLERLYLNKNELTDVTGLENLNQLKSLSLYNNSDLTKAQIAELQKALPKCRIFSNPTK